MCNPLGFLREGSAGRIAVLTDEGAVASLGEEPRIDKSAKHSVARRCIQSPQAPRLFGGQPQSGHLEKLTANPPDYFLNPTMGLTH